METPATPAARPAHLGWRLFALVYDFFPMLALWFAASGLMLLARGGYDAGRKLIADGDLPSALFVSSDRQAAGLMLGRPAPPPALTHGPAPGT